MVSEQAFLGVVRHGDVKQRFVRVEETNLEFLTDLKEFKAKEDKRFREMNQNYDTMILMVEHMIALLKGDGSTSQLGTGVFSDSSRVPEQGIGSLNGTGNSKAITNLPKFEPPFFDGEILSEVSKKLNVEIGENESSLASLIQLKEVKNSEIVVAHKYILLKDDLDVFIEAENEESHDNYASEVENTLDISLDKSSYMDMKADGVFDNKDDEISYNAKGENEIEKETKKVSIKEMRILDSNERPSRKPSLLAVGVEGELNNNEPGYEISYELTKFQDYVTLPAPFVELPVKTRIVVDATIVTAGFERKGQGAAWIVDKKLIGKHAMDLEQLDNGVIVLSSGWKCEKLDKTESLWLNLTDGSILCYRSNWDGGGGDNHVVEHYNLKTSSLIVKLGTITVDLEAAYVFSFDENKSAMNLDWDDPWDYFHALCVSKGHKTSRILDLVKMSKLAILIANCTGCYLIVENLVFSDAQDMVVSGEKNNQVLKVQDCGETHKIRQIGAIQYFGVHVYSTGYGLSLDIILVVEELGDGRKDFQNSLRRVKISQQAQYFEIVQVWSTGYGISRNAILVVDELMQRKRQGRSLNGELVVLKISSLNLGDKVHFKGEGIL